MGNTGIQQMNQQMGGGGMSHELQNMQQNELPQGFGHNQNMASQMFSMFMKNSGGGGGGIQ